MKKKNQGIIDNFYSKEIKRLFIVMLIQTGLCTYLVWWSGYLFFVCFLLGFLILLIYILIVKGTSSFYKVYNGYSLFRQEQLQEDFQEEHPVYKLATGEVHLLSDSLLYRQGGRLFLLPLEEATRMKKVQYKKSYGLSTSLIITTDTMKTYDMEFFGKHQKEIEKVMDWIQRKNPRVIMEP